MAEQKNLRVIALAVILIVAVAGALTYTLMSGGAPEPKAQKERVATEKAAPVEKAKPKVAAPAAAAENPPLTLKALGYMPDQAQMSVGLPPVSSLKARVAPLVQEVFQKDLDVEAELALIARDLAKDMGVEESDDLIAVLAAMGIDTENGAAAFFDYNEVALAALTAATEALEAETAPEMPDLSEAKMALVIPITDKEKAEASLKKLTSDMLTGVTTTEEAEGDVTLVIYENIGAYFMTDNVLALGNDAAMLRAMAKREGAPATFRYGSADCPPDDPNEMVALVYGDRFLPLIESFVGLLAEVQPMAQMYVEPQMEKLKEMYEQGGGEPIIVTLRIDDKNIELKSKIDAEVYPAMLESMGEAQPLRWAPLLPENTLAFLSLGFTPEAKTQIKDVYLQAIPDEVRSSPGVAQGLQFGQSALDLLGQEITLAMTGMEPIDFPSIFLIVEIAEPVSAQILLTMIPQMPHDDPYNGVQIKAVNFPSPIQFYFAMVGNAFIMSNNDAGIRDLIDLVKAEKASSGFFESLNPPLDAATPMYQALLLKPELYNDMVAPLMAMAGNALPAEVGDVFSTLGTLFEDIRYFSEMQGAWLTTRLSVTRTPLN